MSTLWKVTQASLLTGALKLVKSPVSDFHGEATRPTVALAHTGNVLATKQSDSWHEIEEGHTQFGLMKNGNLAMRAYADASIDDFVKAVLSLATITGKRVWTEPSMVSTQFSLPYVTNGHLGYVVRRNKLGVSLELRHNRRLKAVCTPTISLSKGGHVLLPAGFVRERLVRNQGTLFDPFALKKDKKTGREYMEV
jgi:hypothetical protein